MHVTLGESRRVRKPMTVGVLISLLLHVCALAGAAVGTGLSETQRTVEEHPTTVVYTPAQRHPTPTTPTRYRSSGSNSPLPQLPNVGELIPIPSGPVVPLDLVATLPEGATAFRALSLSDHGSADSPHTDSNTAFDAGTVETPVQPSRQNPMPRYPSLLASAGIEGRVVARYVVDTLGLVESVSITVVSSTHPQFERAVREVLPSLRFDAAEFRGRKVRQLVEQVFVFELKR